jgi:hypothetical protein
MKLVVLYGIHCCCKDPKLNEIESEWVVDVS